MYYFLVASTLSYTDTTGYCRGGNRWPSGSLWDCSPGTLSRTDCENACTANSLCAAFDQPSFGSSGECCLFKDGNTGDGNSGRTCSLKQKSKGLLIILLTRICFK